MGPCTERARVGQLARRARAPGENPQSGTFLRDRRFALGGASWINISYPQESVRPPEGRDKKRPHRSGALNQLNSCLFRGRRIGQIPDRILLLPLWRIVHQLYISTRACFPNRCLSCYFPGKLSYLLHPRSTCPS